MCCATRVARNGLFAASMVLTLGFGTVQAFAAPKSLAASGRSAYCDWQVCNYDCKRWGYSLGYCSQEASCVCE